MTPHNSEKQKASVLTLAFCFFCILTPGPSRRDAHLAGVADCRGRPAAGASVVDGDDPLGVIDHIVVADHKAAAERLGAVDLHGVTRGEQGLEARVPVLEPGRVGDGGFQGQRILVAVFHDQLGKEQICPLGKAADKMRKAVADGPDDLRPQRVLRLAQPVWRQTAVPRHAAGFFDSHLIHPPVFLLLYRFFVGCASEVLQKNV